MLRFFPDSSLLAHAWRVTPPLFCGRRWRYNEKLRLDVGRDYCTLGSRTAGLLFLSLLNWLGEDQWAS